MIAETGTPIKPKATMQPLFDALKTAGIVPVHMEGLIKSIARIRNVQGGHGSGAQPRQIDLDEATAAVNAAAAVLVYLASRLP